MIATIFVPLALRCRCDPPSDSPARAPRCRCDPPSGSPRAPRRRRDLPPRSRYNLKWMEEFLPPDDYEGYAEVKRALAGSGVLLSTAEHEYTRYGFRRLIQDRSVDILQPDITWLGGLTEARRVVAMAAAYTT